MGEGRGRGTRARDEGEGRKARDGVGGTCKSPHALAFEAGVGVSDENKARSPIERVRISNPRDPYRETHIVERDLVIMGMLKKKLRRGIFA
jgi:hypothetical protein